MLCEKDYIDIIYELTELNEKSYFNSLFNKFNRFFSINNICDNILIKHHIKIRPQKILNIYNHLCYKGFLEKRIIKGYTIEYALIEYKNYIKNKLFFQLLNSRYSLKNKKYFFNVK